MIVGEPGKPDAQALLRALHSIYAPNKVVLLRSPDSADLLSEIAEFTRHQASLEKKATAYVCTDHVCQQPTTDIDVMLGTISQQAPDSE